MKITNIVKRHILLITLLTFSFTIRVWQLDTNPAGFFCDEASVGYDAWLIAQTGRDRHGDFLPLFFKGFYFDNISPYQVYLTIPFVTFFGLNETAVRLTPVFWSTIELFFFYLLLRLFIPKNFALIGTLLLSISPWHFHLSRINMGDYYSWTFLTLLAFLFLTMSFRSKRTKHFVLTGIFFGLATYSYTPARLITPLLFGFTLSLLLVKKYFKESIFVVMTYTIVIIPLIYFHLTNPNSFQRIKDTVDVNVKNHQSISELKLNFLSKFPSKYLSHYSDTFLFEKGDADFPGQFHRRHSISGLGLMYPYQKFLIIAGIGWVAYMLFIKKRVELIFVFYLLIIFPIADSLTTDPTPYATRSYLGVLPFHLFIAFGVFAVYTLLSKTNILKNNFAKVTLSFLFGAVLLNSLSILLYRHATNPLTTSDFAGWQYGPREIVKYFAQVEDQFDELIIGNHFYGAHIFFNFYAPGKCKKCFVDHLTRFNPNKKQLFALTPGEFTNQVYAKDVHKVIYYPNKTPAFYLAEISGLKESPRNQ